MGKAYSMDLRERVVAAYDEGIRPSVIVRQFRVSKAWVFRLLQRRRENGSIEPRRGQPGRKSKLKPHREELRKLVEANPDATLEELREKLSIKVGMGTLWRALRALNLTLKKKSYAPPNKSGLTYENVGHGGSPRCSTSSPCIWYSLMKRGRRQT